MSLNETYLKCIRCGFEKYIEDPVELFNVRCPRCREILILKYTRPYFRIMKKERGIWRYSLLPSPRSKVTLGEGLTPVTRVEKVFLKDEKFNPTGLYSDRASALIASFVKDLGIKRLNVEYSPEFTRSIVQYLEDLDLAVHANSVMEIDADDLLFFAMKDVKFKGVNPDLHVVRYENPLTIEGLKTIVFELFEQKIDVENIVVPAKTGVLALSMYKGILDLVDAGIDTGFRVIAATIKGSSPQALEELGVIKVVEVSEDELYEAYHEFVRKGFKIKPIVALSYHVARALERSIAIVTMGYKARPSGKESSVKKSILEVLSRRSMLSAYEIWREKPIWTLRGVYKAIKSMENRKEVCFEIRTRGSRKIKYYKLC